MAYPILYDQNQVKFGQLNSAAEILKLFKIIFNRDFKEDLINWFAACPTGANRWYAAFENDQPIAMYGLLPLKIKVGAKIYNGALCNNVGVVPAYQGKGLFQSLGEYALKEGSFPIVIGIPNARAVKGHKRIGWQSYGILELLSGETPAKEPAAIKLNQFKYIKPVKDLYFSVQKNLAFIKWRYAKPGAEYYQSFFNNNDYVIWKNYQGKKQILELSESNLALELGGTVDLWQFKDSSASNSLKSKGFKPILSNEFILYTKLDIAPGENNFNFELGDNDVF